MLKLNICVMPTFFGLKIFVTKIEFFSKRNLS